MMALSVCFNLINLHEATVIFSFFVSFRFHKTLFYKHKNLLKSAIFIPFLPYFGLVSRILGIVPPYSLILTLFLAWGSICEEPPTITNPCHNQLPFQSSEMPPTCLGETLSCLLAYFLVININCKNCACSFPALLQLVSLCISIQGRSQGVL